MGRLFVCNKCGRVYFLTFNCLRYILRIDAPRSYGGVFIMAKESTRPDRAGAHRTQFLKNKKIIFQTQTVCGICGTPVDFTQGYPHPLSPCIDHRIPVAKGGHPSAMENLQLAHWICNRKKSDKLIEFQRFDDTPQVLSNRILPQSIDWSASARAQAKK